MLLFRVHHTKDEMFDCSVSFIIAGYNEVNNVLDTVNETYDVLKDYFKDFEIILIDDGSKDNSLEVMKKCSKNYTNVRIMENLINLNFGSSVLRGMLAANKDYIVYDAFDLPLKPSVFVEKFKEMLENNSDVLVLQRESYSCTFWRKITSSANSILLKILFPKLTMRTPVLNFTQIYKQEIIRSIIPLARSPIFVWPELIFRAKLNGYKVDNTLTKPYIKEVRRGAFGHPHDIIWGVYDMLRFRMRLWMRKI